VFQAPLSGTGDPVRVTSFAESTVALALSPDDQLLVYAAQSPTTGSDLWMMRMSGDRQVSPLVKTAGDDQAAQLSTDGKWLVYESNLSGPKEVYVQSFPTAGERVQVSTRGGAQPRWRPDGRELFYVAPNGDLMAVPMATGTNERTPKPGAPVALFRTRLATGLGITTLAPTFVKPQYAVARDGRFLMNVALEPPPAPPIGVVVNWMSLLDQSSAAGR
jgi:WD40-like Beta Propeller Repeat